MQYPNTEFLNGFHQSQLKDWTLFLDRDGVINVEKYEDYIHHWREFIFYPHAAQTIAALSKLFARTIVVTNQKGVGKGVTKLEDLEEIHTGMSAAVEDNGGHIDAIFFCTDLDNESPNRKPNPGMAFQALQQFPQIQLAKSIMVGNNLSDLYFGRNAGMKTVFLRTTKPDILLPANFADLDLPDLKTFGELMAQLPV